MQRPNETKMIGRTHERDAVWSTNGGKPFLMPTGGEMTPLTWLQRFTWPKKWAFYRRLPEPHLNYGQVATAVDKSRRLLKALRAGPVVVKNGFIYSRSNRMIMTRAIAEVVLHWMEGCGFVFTRENLGKKRVRLDLDAEATATNKVT